MSKSGKVNSNLYALGELTKGTFLATTDVGQVLKQIKVCCNALFKSLIAQDKLLEVESESAL